MFLIFILNIQHQCCFFQKSLLGLPCSVPHLLGKFREAFSLLQNHISWGIVEFPGQFLLFGGSLGAKVQAEVRTSTDPSKGLGWSPCKSHYEIPLRILIRLLRWSLKRALRSLWKVLPSGQVHIFHSLHRSKERVEGGVHLGVMPCRIPLSWWQWEWMWFKDCHV